MAKMTKTQIKRLYSDIRNKAIKLHVASSSPIAFPGPATLMSTKDFIAIDAIITKYQKKMR